MHIARKRFGQHFLSDAGIIHAIVEAIAPAPGQALIEIGPGLGALTYPLVALSQHLTVIELDRDLAARLRKKPHLTVIESDVLKVDFEALAGAHEARPLRVVGNLPYNISTPILFHLLRAADLIVDQHVMLQKEVALRVSSPPDCADYGRLSVMLQWRYETDFVLEVPPQAFTPPPQVDSAVVRMRTKAPPQGMDMNVLGTLVMVAFSQRRKLLRHTLGPWLAQAGYGGNFDLQRRAQEVDVPAYLALARELSQDQPKNGS